MVGTIDLLDFGWYWYVFSVSPLRVHASRSKTVLLTSTSLYDTTVIAATVHRPDLVSGVVKGVVGVAVKDWNGKASRA
jgi:hypothetical protein